MNRSNHRAKRAYVEFTVWIMALAPVLFGLSSAAIKPVPLTVDEIRSRVKEDRTVLTKDQEPVSGPIDLYEAMARALKYNLDARVELMHKMLTQTQLDLSHYAMLPRLVANAGFDGRNNFPGGVAQSLFTGRQVLEPFTSAEKNIFSADLSLSWPVFSHCRWDKGAWRTTMEAPMKLNHPILKANTQKAHSLLDRRYAERVPIGYRITYTGEEGARIITGKGVLKDLSKTGCKILGVPQSPLGSRLTLLLGLEDGQAPMRIADAVVSRISKDSFAVKFPKLSSEERKRLQDVILKNISLSSLDDRRAAFRIV